MKCDLWYYISVSEGGMATPYGHIAAFHPEIESVKSYLKCVRLYFSANKVQNIFKSPCSSVQLARPLILFSATFLLQQCLVASLSRKLWRLYVTTWVQMGTDHPSFSFHIQRKYVCHLALLVSAKYRTWKSYTVNTEESSILTHTTQSTRRRDGKGTILGLCCIGTLIILKLGIS